LDLEMGTNDSEKGKQGCAHSRDLEDFQKMSQRILHLVNISGPTSVFMREASTLLLDYSRCDEVGLLMMKGDNYYKSTATRSAERPPVFEMETYTKKEIGRIAEGSAELDPLERLSLDVLHGGLRKAAPFFSGNGSFWTGGADGPVSYEISYRDAVHERELHIGGPYQTIAVIPILKSDERIGLLQLKSREENFLGEDDIRLFEDIAQALGVAQAYRITQSALRERVKELTCLYSIAQVAEQPGVPLAQLLQQIVELIPPAWQYSDITSSRIVLDDKIYVTEGFGESAQKQTARIVVREEKRGTVEVYYRERKPELFEGPFLKEERHLLDAVAREVALIIERKEADEAELKLQDQLRHADRLATIGQLAAGVAHELNEPLGNVLGFAQLIAKAPELPGQAGKDIGKIVSSTLHAREVVKKLMFFARQMPPEKVPCDLNQIVEEGIYFLGARCAKAGIELVRDLAVDLPMIIADPSQLHQVLINLAVNAMQAMPQGGSLTIRTSADTGFVSLTVEDTGTGMTDDVIKQIFVPFFTTKDVDEGTGLGLAVVHGIVSSHGGAIDVESEHGHGSRFVVRLPMRQLSHAQIEGR
jgi:two-component system NtrC family sensor kinase